MKTFEQIFNIFNDEKNDYTGINLLIKRLIDTHKELWCLEDVARMKELGNDVVAQAKYDIDKTNQKRNDLVQDIDLLISIAIGNSDLDNMDIFYSESPAMIIDRLCIILLKAGKIREIVGIIEEKDLKEEYIEKEKVLNDQISKLGAFFDGFMSKVSNKQAYFMIQRPVKIYNDPKVREYIKILQKK